MIENRKAIPSIYKVGEADVCEGDGTSTVGRVSAIFI